MLFISTKAGFTDESLVQQLVQAKQLNRRDVYGGHTMAPAYIAASVDASLERLNLKTEVVAVAKEAAGGKPSGFAAVQLPVSATMSEAWSHPWQRVGGGNASFMQAAEVLGVRVFTSGPLGEGDLLRRLTARLDPLVQLRTAPTTAQKLLQLARSTPGGAMTTTLVGHKTREFVEANTKLSRVEPLTEEEFHGAMFHLKAILEAQQPAQQPLHQRRTPPHNRNNKPQSPVTFLRADGRDWELTAW
ncbi:hypothetical protein VOLCADRAFT_104973 [Volvox carteri f. nagariensis]|uniref:Uncharacterized protein n=1 Tax=Volvox carteri f. nagariensis TaxID=3068 RepID=D8TXJ0_VOLCA|nr:uncharacterized protein VOLCADRAFT_104973 [Volvox carteri f. nagariensis]EFJ47730.1 hypothetical protein VOLCADRAFT_104973 [Volvox carteri f. nagariensis]|eukprot:XP_002951201.1 hypothetical protein VOLCADRAFT_104973 [Volvox carteri f. nagariensis]